MPWIKLRRPKQIRSGGVTVSHRPGDSVLVGRQTALEWILDGSAEDPFGQVGPPVQNVGPKDDKYGLVIRGSEKDTNLSGLGDLVKRVKVSYGLPAIPYDHTCIWRPDHAVSSQLMNYGFLRIAAGNKPPEAWQLAAGLLSVDKTAADVGSEGEKSKTLKVIGDLRLPVYDTGVIWARNCPAAQAVIEAWAAELESGADEYHAFLRALYTKRAMICTLPMDWTSR